MLSYHCETRDYTEPPTHLAVLIREAKITWVYENVPVVPRLELASIVVRPFPLVTARTDEKCGVAYKQIFGDCVKTSCGVGECTSCNPEQIDIAYRFPDVHVSGISNMPALLACLNRVARDVTEWHYELSRYLAQISCAPGKKRYVREANNEA